MADSDTTQATEDEAASQTESSPLQPELSLPGLSQDSIDKNCILLLRCHRREETGAGSYVVIEIGLFLCLWYM